MADSVLNQNTENPTMAPELLDDLLEKSGKCVFVEDKIRVWVKINNKFFGGKNEKILEFLARTALGEEKFALTQGFAVHCSDLSISRALLLEWSKKGPSNEQDLYVIRYLLLKLVSKRQKEAEKLFAFFKEEGYLDSLLANMIKFVFRSIDLNSAEVFERLLVTYEKSMQRDPELKMLMEKIGEVYFNIRKAQPTNFLATMMQNFMQQPQA